MTILKIVTILGLFFHFPVISYTVNGVVVKWCRGVVVKWCRGVVVTWCRGVVLWLCSPVM